MLFCWDKAEQDRQAGQEEVAARHWLSVLQVDREYEVPRIKDVGVNLLVKIASGEAGVCKLWYSLSSKVTPHHRHGHVLQ